MPAGIVAERCFGFRGSVAETAEAGSAEVMRNADALASSLLASLIVPWFLCLLFYTGELLVANAYKQLSVVCLSTNSSCKCEGPCLLGLSAICHANVIVSGRMQTAA